MDEEKTLVNSNELNNSQEPSVAVNGGEGASDQVKEDEHSSRMDAAKAFYRALYSGEETTAGKGDMGTSTSINSGARGQELGNCANCQATEELMLRADARANEAEALYKRMAADFDNYRKRTDRERDELHSFGMQKAIEALLPALDDLDRAQTTLLESADARTVLDSLKLVYTRFTKCMEQLGIKQMESVGQQFDPRLHEPVQQIETDSVPDGQVVHDLRRGYTMGDKIIRPSLVNVAIGGAQVLAPDNTKITEQTSLDKEGKSDYSASADAKLSDSQHSFYDAEEQETQELPIVARKNRTKQENEEGKEAAELSNVSETPDKNEVLDGESEK
jgi:molecular chaperone GrpE